MEELFSNKYMLLAIGILIFIGSIMLGIDMFNIIDNKKETIEHKTYKYKMFIKTSEVISIDFEASFDECEDSMGKKYACGNYSDRVLTTQLTNLENSWFGNIKFEGKSVIEVINIILDTTLKNDYSKNTIKIISNYEFNYKDINDDLKKKFSLNDDFKVIGITRNSLDEKAILEELREGTALNLYKISFDVGGGSPISEQEIVENELLSEPIAPLKEGYEFIEWQVNGFRYDFNTPVTEDLILTASWKEVFKEEITTVTTAKIDDKNDEVPVKTTTATKKTTSKILSSFNKINLTDNILVYTEVRGSTCGYYYFSKGINENGEIIYDELAEEDIINELEKTKFNLPAGIKDFSYFFEDHKLRVTYTALLIGDKYSNTTLYKNWLKHINQISDIWSKATYTGTGLCNSQRSNQVILNEQLCTNFNLNCLRW